MVDSIITNLKINGHVSTNSSATFGEGCVQWQYSTICEGAKFGKDCVIGSNAWVGRGVTCGDHVRIQHGAFIANGSRIGNRVFIGPNVTFTDDKYPRVNNTHYLAEPPVIEDDVAIGAGAVICPGVRIGAGAIVGAGAVVTDNVCPHSTVVGIPARELRGVYV